jgi:hypothetical protein
VDRLFIQKDISNKHLSIEIYLFFLNVNLLLLIINSYLQSKGILCVADEVQTGFGRSGTHFWAFQSYEEGYLANKIQTF